MKAYNNRIQKFEIPLPKIIVSNIAPVVVIPEHKTPEMVGRNTATAATRQPAIIHAVVQIGIAGIGLMDIKWLVWRHIIAIDHIAR